MANRLPQWLEPEPIPWSHIAWDVAGQSVVGYDANGDRRVILGPYSSEDRARQVLARLQSVESPISA